jgi:hypothetical protein
MPVSTAFLFSLLALLRQLYHTTRSLTCRQDYRDATSATPLHPVTSFAYPTKDDQGNPLTTEFGLSVYKDHQTITVQGPFPFFPPFAPAFP